MKFGKITKKEERLGITLVLIVVVIVVILIVAGIGIYYFVLSSNSGPSLTTLSSSHSSTTSQTRSASTNPVHATLASTSAKSTTVSSGIITYGGTFNFSLALGPSGVRTLSNYTVQMYSSTEVGSGSFTFFISAVNKSGSGSGQGTLVVTTTGFCSGKVIIPYTFKVPDATTLLGNLTVFFGTPTPANYTVPLSCYGPMAGVNTSTNNPGPYLSVYPNEISTATTPVTVTKNLSGNISYSYTIS